MHDAAPAHLFFYGVLLGELASTRIAALLAGLGPGRPAMASGTLYAIDDPRGWYPALLPGEGEVHGMVHAAGRVDVPALDRFEGVDPHDPRAGEYRREAIRVAAEGGELLMAQAYLYNRAPAPDHERIPYGDFACWLRQTGRHPLAG